MKTYLLLFCSLLILSSAQGQTGPRLVGMSEYGAYSGTIFQYTGGADSLSPTHVVLSYSSDPMTVSMTQGANGKFYGLTDANGYSPYSYWGNVIEYDCSTNISKIMVYFHGPIANPSGALLLANNNKFYGLTAAGGDPNLPGGTIFSYSEGDTFVTKLVNLPNGADPVNSMIQASDGNLYGMTDYDGSNLSGTIFRYNISTNVYTALYSLSPNAFPSGNLLEVGRDTLYGLTQLDGTEPSAVSSYNENSGTLFRYIISTGAYDTLHNMDSNATPQGSLIKGSDGLLYGTTSGDGSYGGGTIFS